jgi:cell division protein FtsB
VAALELGKQYDATKEAVQSIEKEFLVKLREIKSQLESEGGGLLSNANTKEMETLRAENEELKRKNAKLEYRVQHLVASLEKYYKCNPDAM